MKKQKIKYRRLFLALWPEADVHHLIYGCQQALNSRLPAGANVREVRPENLHLTLRFLGAVAEDQLEPLCACLGEIRHPVFELNLKRLGYFAGSGTLWLGLKESQPVLLDLIEKFDGVLLQCLPGFKPDRKNFIAHISLYHNVEEVIEGLDCAVISWPVLDFALVESVTSDAGAEYHVLRRWCLQKN